MNASVMTTAEILDAMVPWAPVAHAADSPTRAFLDSDSTARMFLPAIDRARALLASMPREDTAFARLTEELIALDARHDARGRFIVLALQAFTRHLDEAIAKKARELLRLFFPDGVSFITASYAEEAGLAVVRAELLTPEHRGWFESFPMPGGGTLATQLDALQDDARSLGAKATERGTLGSDGTVVTPQAMLDARRTIVRLVQRVMSNWAALEREGLLDGTAVNYTHALRDGWNKRVKTATDNAVARRASEPTTTSGPATPGPTGTT